MADDRNRMNLNPHNLVIAVIGCVVISGICSITVYLTCDFILDAYQDTNAQALLLTGDKIISDDKNLEAKLNTAQIALMTCRDVCLAMGLGSCMVGSAMGFQIVRGIRPKAD